MKKKFFLKLCSGALSLSLAGVAQAQLPTSKLGNANPVSLPAGSTTLVGIPGLGAAADGAGGVVTGSAGNTVTVASATFPVVGSGTHTLIVGTGPEAGEQRAVSGSTATTVTYLGTPLVLDVGVDRVEMAPSLTLNTALGAPPEAIAGAGSAASADIVIVNAVRYFYRTTAPFVGWQPEVGAPVIGGVGATTIIPRNAAIYVIKRAASPAGTITADAIAYTCPRVCVAIAAGTNILSWPFLGDVTLDGSGLSSVVTGSGSAASADIVIAGGVRYFFRTGGPPFGGKWQLEVGAPSATGFGSTVLNPGGKGFIILRRFGGATTWKAIP